MTSFDDMSRDELVKYAKEITASANHQANHPPFSNCPFCYGKNVVPSIKCQVKGELIDEWHKDVTPHY
jgi:hypothetical protein